MIDLGALKLSINVDTQSANSSLNEFGNKTKESSSKFGSFISKAKKLVVGGAVAAGIGKATSALKDGISKTIEHTDAVDKASQKIGISSKAYQEWDHVLSQSGVDIGVMRNGVKTLVNQMSSAAGGSKSANEAFKSLGLSIKDNNGNLKDQETMMNEAMEALAGMKDGTERAKLATTLFGKAGTELAPVLNEGKDGIKALKQEANDLGLVMDEKTIKSGVKLGDTIENIKSAVSAMANQIMAQLMPYVQQAASYIIEHMPQIKAAVKNVIDNIKKFWNSDLKPIVDSIVVIIQEIVKQARTNGTMLNTIVKNIVKTVKSAFKVVQDVFKVFKDLFTGDTKALKKDMGTLLKDIISLIKNVMSNFFSVGKQLLGKLWDGIKSVFGTIKDGIVNFVKEKIIQPIKDKFGNLKTAGKELFTHMWDGIKGVWDSIKSWVAGKVDWLKEKLLFWKKGKKKIDGSHRTGADYIPYDGYIAELHKGEMVLTAAQAREYKNQTTQQQQSAPAANITVNNYSPKALNEAESARLFRQTQRKLVLGF